MLGTQRSWGETLGTQRSWGETSKQASWQGIWGAQRSWEGIWESFGEFWAPSGAGGKLWAPSGAGGKLGAPSGAGGKLGAPSGAGGKQASKQASQSTTASADTDAEDEQFWREICGDEFSMHEHCSAAHLGKWRTEGGINERGRTSDPSSKERTHSAAQLPGEVGEGGIAHHRSNAEFMNVLACTPHLQEE